MDLDKYKERLREEEDRLKDYADCNNLNWSEEKIKFMAKRNIVQPKGDGWE